MLPYAAPVVFALFLWWFSTGIILYLDGLPKRTFRWSMLGAAIILVASIRMLATGNQDMSVGGAYAAFSFGLLAWGWQEISFYMGMVTGIRTEPCPEGCSGWRHFGHAVRVSIFHELSIIATAAVVFAVVWPGSNHIGLWTYVVLWWMHQSAKLNVLLGVRNLNEDFLPEHMAFLKSFLTKKPMNLLFPVSVTISTVIAVLLFQRALSPGASDVTMTGFMFLGALMALAILEHWFLVLPLPSEALWQWSLRSRPVRKPFDVDVVAGFLGAGKTTYIRRLLASADPAVRTIVLVNDFGSLGIDASLLTGRGAEIVELPNGCICCSLRQDLAQQLKDAIARWAPRRVIIEPSGVADVAGLLAVLGRPEFARNIGHLQVCTIVDAGSFLRDYARMHTFFEAQARMATLLIVNKTDVAAPGELAVVEASLRDLNPEAAILRARHGLVQAAGFDPIPASGGQLSAHAGAAATSWHIHGRSDRNELDDGSTIGYDPVGHQAGHALDFASWSGRLADSCNPQGLQELLDAVARGAYGQIERVKGVARAGAGWVHFDVAGGRSSVAAFAPARDEEQRVTAIGRALDGMRLQAAFEACAMRGELSC